jgi:RNA polymerase sigma-70 factor (ECF subfamily)
MGEDEDVLRDWMVAAQAGDRRAYERLLASLVPALRRAARGRWRQAEAADIEDVVQETLLALHAARHLYEPSRPLLPFVFGILRLRGADALRRRYRQSGRERAIDEFSETSSYFATKEEHEDQIDAGTLHATIAELPERQRQAIEMTKMQEMSLAEASAASGMSITALKVATHRGVATLRKLLRGAR